MQQNLFSLFREIFGQPWAFDENEAMFQQSLIMSMLNDHSLANAFFAQLNERNKLDHATVTTQFISDHKLEASSLIGYPGARRMHEDDIPEESTAVIPITGPLTKEGGFCSYGMNDMVAWLNHAEANPKISKIIILVDTPGGSVNGTMKLANRIATLSKPNVALVDGLAMSAGMWIATSAKKVVALNETCNMGSIGVALFFSDRLKRNEKEGIKDHAIHSNHSPDKNKPLLNALQGDYELIKVGQLDPLAIMFINAIKENRPESEAFIQTWNSGKTFFAKEALAMKLIDEIGGLSVVNDLLNEQLNTYKSNPPTFMNGEKFPLVLGALGLESIEMQDGGAFLSEELLAAIESELKAKTDEAKANADALAEATPKIDQLTQDIEAKTTELTEATDKIEGLETQNSELTTKNEELKAENETLKNDPEENGGGASGEGDFSQQQRSTDDEASLIYQNSPMRK